MSLRVHQLGPSTLTAPMRSPEWRLGAGIGAAATAVIAVALALTWSLLVSPNSGVAAAASTVPFVAQGLGQVEADVMLRDHPSRGGEVALVRSGSVLTVGGLVEVSAGLRSVDVYWVKAPTTSGDRFGFLPAGAVDITAGAPPRLDMAQADISSLLNPQEGVSHQLIGSGAGLGTASAPEAVAMQSGRDQAKAVATSEISIPWLPDTVARWEPLLLEAAARHGVDPELLAIITLVESGGNPRARSGAGATGLMQVMPATGMDIAGQRGIAGFDPSQLYDPETNIDFGAWYISEMLRMFGRADDPGWFRSVELAAAAYNGGPGTVQRHLRAGTALPNESSRYRRWVGSMWQERDGDDSPGFQSWWAAGGRVLVEQAASG